MSPLKHYQGPILPGVQEPPVLTPDPQLMAALHPTRPAEPEPAQAVDKPEEPKATADADADGTAYVIVTKLFAYRNGTFGAHLTSDGYHAVGDAEHPEMALMLAFTKLWSLLDRPRCTHCGQLLPEEGQTV